MRSLVVAAGGGGDAITAAMLSGLAPLGLPPGEPVPVLTYSWDRLLVDPLPGPRSASDFTGLRQLATDVHEVTTTTAARAPAGSSLPRLAGELPVRLLLLDPAGGAAAMASQVRAAAAFFDCSQVLVLDVGGDILTDGHDPQLRSPLADQLALAACLRADLPTRVLIAAAGLDGEIDPDTLTRRLHDLDADDLGTLDPGVVEPLRAVFRWHPSEASGMFAAATVGRRGRVEVRDAGDQVVLNDDTPRVHAVPAHRLAALVPAMKLLDTTSVGEAEQITRDVTGRSEIAYETRKATSNREDHRPDVHDLSRIDQATGEAHHRGADYISLRRLSELLGARTLPSYTALTELLAHERTPRYDPPLYRTTTEPA